MLSIHFVDPPEALARAVERDSLTWPIIHDHEFPEAGIAKEWEIRLLGTNFVIDEKGIIREKLVFDEDLDRAIEKWVAKLR